MPMDLAPLTAPMPPGAVQAWRAQAQAAGYAWARTSGARIAAIALAVVVGGFVALMLLGTVIGMLVAAAGSGSVGQAVLAVVLLGLGALVLVVIIRQAVRGGARWARWARIDAFARANGLRFSPADPPPGYPGLIFGLGSGRVVREHVSAEHGRFVDMGGYEYVTGSGRSRTTHRWSFLAIRLDRRLPNMLLDSKANNGVLGTNLPVALARNQVLHLEGDFDRYFTLYCPSDYETDALYVFTPDLMALLIDEAAPFDVEIVDDWFFAYSSRPLDMAQPATYQRLFRIIDTVGAKTLSQTERYSDDRIGDRSANIVAPQGARLRRGVGVGAVVGVIVIVAWIVIQAANVALNH